MARERAHSEALIVLLLEMFVFLGFCFGVQAVIPASDEQPVLVTTVVVGLALRSATMALAAGVNEFSATGGRRRARSLCWCAPHGTFRWRAA